MVLLNTTPAMAVAAQTAFKRLQSDKSTSSSTDEAGFTALRQWINDATDTALPPMSHVAAVAAHRLAADDKSFGEFVRGAGLVLAPPPPRQKSDQLKQLLRDAEVKAENLEYARMTDDLVPKHSMSQLTRQEKFEFNATIGMFSGILNVLLSMVAVFVAVMWVGDTVTRDVGMKTLLALFFAFVVGIAEGWFFSRDWLFEDAQVKKPMI
ncbi:hypothetical protein HDU79_005039 [Rhizoclosmatium sp. JEL0117]|nr:hypothetical protein HDU79_005039 [Rhizoclosmatium sp. JEL0117]